MRFKRCIIVGREDEIHLGRYRSSISPKAVFATLNAFEIRYDVPIVFCPTATLAAHKVESWVWWFAREHVLAANNLLRAARITNGEEVPNAQS
jgi:hypothetical protein